MASGITPNTKRFAGGELVFFTDRVELLGVKIISDRGAGLTMQLLYELRKRHCGNRYLPIAAEELARILDVPDVNTITGCIRVLRRNIVTRLQKHLNTEIGPSDVICRDEQGYCLVAWIVTRDGDKAGTDKKDVADVPADPILTAKEVRAVPKGELNERQLWALHQLDLGVKLQRTMLEQKFDVGDKTAKRDLIDLSRRGAIEYVRVGRQGYYRRVGGDDLKREAC